MQDYLTNCGRHRNHKNLYPNMNKLMDFCYLSMLWELRNKKTSGIISNFTLSLRAEKCQSLQCKTRKQKSEKALCDK